MLCSQSRLVRSNALHTFITSPEPFSNWAASFGEDGGVLGGLFLAIRHPALFLALVAWLLPKLIRFLAFAARRLTGRERRALPNAR